MASKNRVQIRINGKDYTVVGEESPEYIQKVALYIDRKMNEVMKTNDRLSTSMAAVLTAINVADDYFKNIDTTDCLRTQVQQYIEELNKCAIELKRYEKENRELNEEIQQLKIELAKKETQLNIDRSLKGNRAKMENINKYRIK